MFQNLCGMNFQNLNSKEPIEELVKDVAMIKTALGLETKSKSPKSDNVVPELLVLIKAMKDAKRNRDENDTNTAKAEVKNEPTELIDGLQAIGNALGIESNTKTENLVAEILNKIHEINVGDSRDSLNRKNESRSSSPAPSSANPSGHPEIHTLEVIESVLHLLQVPIEVVTNPQRLAGHPEIHTVKAKMPVMSG